MVRVGLPDDSFANVFGAALGASRLTLSALRRRLIDSGNPVSMATLSYWRSGERVPDGAASLAAIEEIERMLGLPDGALVLMVPERARLGTVPSSVNPFTEEYVQTAMSETMELLEAPPLDIVRDVTSHAINDVGSDGYLRRQRGTTLIQSVVPDTVELITNLSISDGAPFNPPEMHVRGAEIVRSHMHPSRLVYGIVMRLDRPLSLGASTMLEMTVDPDPDRSAPQPEFGALAVRPVRDLTMWTRFHPDAIPDWIDEIETLDDREEKFARPLRPQASVHQSRRDFGPGALGIQWGYDGRWDRPEFR